MHMLKAVRDRDGVKHSHTYECTHFTVDELPDYFKVEFPQQAEDGTWPQTEIQLPRDYDAIYQMSPSTGDTLDSWTWDKDKGTVRKGTHAKV